MRSFVHLFVTVVVMSKSISPIVVKFGMINVQHLHYMSLFNFLEVKVKVQSQNRRTENISLFKTIGRGLIAIFVIAITV